MKKTLSNNQGFTVVQMVITVAVLATVTAFAVMGITRARAGVRLSNSARQFAAYVERARADAVRRHATAEVQTLNTTSYAVTMDFDNTGTPTTRNFTLESGVIFTTEPKSIIFDWRGRIFQEESFGFYNKTIDQSISVGITGSGDVTFDSQFFHDYLLPPVTVTGQSGDLLPDPSPGSPYGGSPSSSPSPGASPGQGGPSPTPTATPTANPSPTPTPTPTATPTPTPTATPTPHSNPSPGPHGTPTPDPTPTPYACTLTANPASLTIAQNGSRTVTVNRNNITGMGTITATSSNAGQIQVTPSSRNVSGTNAANFSVTVKRLSGSVTFTATACQSKTVSVTIQ